ncbi:type III effector [Vibrio sp. CAIM 722]|uniref:Type III effector n=1 Tax=Vibrio eleionomae TaxID=2653505 RepID=A0A7X4RUP7_9VIBR|nr:HopJ type III effector protein [Vibrio eleionomae]MZI93728.1 type III effector [Vibrio eleionomae]
MDIKTLLEQITISADKIQFKEVIASIESAYEFTPVAFTNGNVENAEGQNQGSCKIFAFAKLHGLTPEQTIACFGEIYRDEVLAQPTADNHQNIRQFIANGWEGVTFAGEALSPKK